MTFVRMFGPVTPKKQILGVHVKVIAQQAAKITDLQFLGGTNIFSWTPHVHDLQLVISPTWRYINGIITPGDTVGIVADEDRASPYFGRFTPWSPQTVHWDQLRLGLISTDQLFNGRAYQLTAGAGVTPQLTARADQRVNIKTNGTMNVILAISGVSISPGGSGHLDTGPVTMSHVGDWLSVLAWHPTWGHVVDSHGSW